MESRGVWVVHDPFPESRLVTFTVTDTNKNPINGAWVSAEKGDCCEEGYTNILGYAELYLPLGDYTFIVWADGYFGYSGTFIVPGDAEIVVLLDSPGETFRTEFVVTDPDQEPVANAFIFVASEYFWARGSCDSEGNLVLNLPEGEYSLYIEANGFATKHSHQVEFCVPRDAKVVTVLLPLDDLFSVGFTVFDPEGEPVENAYVEVDCGDFYFNGYTDWDGGLTLNLPEGNYEVLVLAEGYATYTGEFAVPVEMQVTIKLSWE